MLAALSALGRRAGRDRLVEPAHASRGRARRARPRRSSTQVEVVPEPAAALARARELAGAGGRRPRHRLPLPARGSRRRPPVAPTMASVGERLSVFALAAIVLVAILAIALWCRLVRREDPARRHERSRRTDHDHHPGRRTSSFQLFRYFSDSQVWIVARNIAISFLVVFCLCFRVLGLQGRAPADRGPMAPGDGPRRSASSRRSCPS